VAGKHKRIQAFQNSIALITGFKRRGLRLPVLLFSLDRHA
jgi:hypothetical protein